MDRGSQTGDKTIKKHKIAKWLSKKALQRAEKKKKKRERGRERRES